MDFKIFTTRVRKLTVRRLFWEFLFLLLAPICFAILSIVLDDWTWFSRSGALMVAISIFSLGISFIRVQQADRLKQASPAPNEVKNPEIQQGLRNKHILHYTEESRFHYGIGFVGGFVGTIIWGFGDLLNLL